MFWLKVFPCVAFEVILGFFENEGDKVQCFAVVALSVQAVNEKNMGQARSCPSCGGLANH